MPAVVVTVCGRAFKHNLNTTQEAVAHYRCLHSVTELGNSEYTTHTLITVAICGLSSTGLSPTVLQAGGPHTPSDGAALRRTSKKAVASIKTIVNRNDQSKPLRARAQMKNENEQGLNEIETIRAKWL